MPSKKKTQNKKKPREGESLPGWLPAPVAVRMREIMAVEQSAADSDERDTRFIALVTDVRMKQVWTDIGNELERAYGETVTGDQLKEWVADGQYNILYYASDTDARLLWSTTVPTAGQWKKDKGKIQHHVAELRKLLNNPVLGLYDSFDEAWNAMLAPRQFTPWDVFDRTARNLLSKGDPEYISLTRRYQRTRFGDRQEGTNAPPYWPPQDARTMLNTLDVELQLIEKLAAHASLPNSWRMNQSDNFPVRVYVRKLHNHLTRMGLRARRDKDGPTGFALNNIIAIITNVVFNLTGENSIKPNTVIAMTRNHDKEL